MHEVDLLVAIGQANHLSTFPAVSAANVPAEIKKYSAINSNMISEQSFIYLSILVQKVVFLLQR